MELILVINAGSSSHKCALFEGESKAPIWRAHLEWKEGFRDAQLTVDWRSAPITIQSAHEGLEKILQTLPTQAIGAVGHRIVHGGEKFRKTTPITDEVKEQIAELTYLAPLHNPANLIGIETVGKLFPTLPQFAIFDTAFHATLPEVHYTYPIPLKWRNKGVRRYGFHGISHAYCSKKAAEFLNRDLRTLKIVVCHLGAGASLCAVSGGISIDTTMGMTPLEGLMMASRSGTIDPGILLHLIDHEKLSTETLGELLNKESGLLGISEISEDLRDVQKAAEQGNSHARLAIELFVHSVRRHLGSMIASLGGLDVLVFTAGIGEHAPNIREAICAPFAFMGLAIDTEKNISPATSERIISAENGAIPILVLPTQEEWEIAHEVATCRSGHDLLCEGCE